jgi:hypothetical protein
VFERTVRLLPSVYVLFVLKTLKSLKIVIPLLHYKNYFSSEIDCPMEVLFQIGSNCILQPNPAREIRDLPRFEFSFVPFQYCHTRQAPMRMIEVRGNVCAF